VVFLTYLKKKEVEIYILELPRLFLRNLGKIFRAFT
jgi:hypothetical protein